MCAIWIGIKVVVVILAIIVAVLLPVLKSSTVLAVIFGIIFVILAIVLSLGLYAYIVGFNYFATTSFVIEENGVMESIGRGFSVASFKFFRYAGAMILMSIIVLIPTIIRGFAGGFIGGMIGSDIISYVIATLVGIIFMPIMYILFAVLLYDYKVRKEGFDINQEFNDLVNNEG
jgi:hypothetical protein